MPACIVNRLGVSAAVTGEGGRSEDSSCMHNTVEAGAKPEATAEAAAEALATTEAAAKTTAEARQIMGEVATEAEEERQWLKKMNSILAETEKLVRQEKATRPTQH